MCGRYVIKNPVTKTSKLIKSAIQVEDSENYNAHPYQKLPVIKKAPNLPKNFLKRIYLYSILFGDFIEEKLLYNSFIVGIL